MISYKDMTFCNANCTTTDCERNQQHVPSRGFTDLPIAWCDFSPECAKYRPMQDKSDGRHPS